MKSARLLPRPRILAGLLVALVVACTVSAHAAAGEVLRDEDLFARWLRASPEVASWRAQIGSARFDAVTAGLAPNPTFSFTVTQLAAGENVNGKTSYAVQLEIPLPIFGQLALKRGAALSMVSVAELSVEVAVWQRSAEIQRAMLGRAFSSSRVAMLEANLLELDRLDGIVRKRAAAGANSAYDVLRVQTTAATMRAALANAKIERDRAESTLVALIADPSLTQAPIERAGLAGFVGPEDEARLLEVAFARRPDLELTRRSAVALDRTASAYRRSAVPMPSLFLAPSVTQGPFSLGFTAGLSMPLPLFDRNQGAVARVENDAAAQRDLSLAVAVRIRTEVTSAFRARQAAKAALGDFQREGLTPAATLLTRAETTYQAGAFSIAELFDAYRTVWDARTQALDLERQMADSEAEVEHACVLVAAWSSR